MRLSATIARWRAKHSRSRRGVAAVEFALSLPIWITLLLGASDATYYILFNSRTDLIPYTIANIVTQFQTQNNAQPNFLTKAELDDIVLAAKQLSMTPNSNFNGYVMITSVQQPPADQGPSPLICWQYKGGGILPQLSKVGTANGAGCGIGGAVATLPNGLTLNPNDNVIITEVWYNYAPLFVYAGLFPAQLLYRTAEYMPRTNPLIVPPT